MVLLKKEPLVPSKEDPLPLPFDVVALAAPTLMFLVFALARRRNLSSEDVAMRHPVRRGIFDLIRRRPGARLNTIWRAFSTNRGTAQYHLVVLERVGVIQAVREGQATRYFPSGMEMGEIPGLALLLRGRVLEVARAVLREPGISQRRLTRLLPISRKVFREYANRLTALDLLAEVRDAKVKRYFPTPRLHQMVDRLGDPVGQGEDDRWPPS